MGKLQQRWQHCSCSKSTYKCSAESTSRCFSFPLGILWSMTIVSVLAKQNPFDRMISVGRRKKTRFRKKKKAEQLICVSYVIVMVMNWDVCMTLKTCTGKQEKRVDFTAPYCETVICKLTALKQLYSSNQFMTQSIWSNYHYQIIIVFFLVSPRLKQK